MTVPRARRDYPVTIEEFESFFPTDAAALDWLLRLRWPMGWECGCGSRLYWLRADERMVCSSCRRTHTPLSGTLLSGTRIGPKRWLRLLWLISMSRSSITASTVSEQIGLSFKTTWVLMHKVRRAMMVADQQRLPLRGTVEADEVFVGGPQPGPRGRGALGKETLLVIAERKRQHGTIVIVPIANADKEHILPLVLKSVAPGAHIHTDGASHYLSLPKHGYKYTRYPLSRLEIPAHEVLPTVHNVAALFKGTWIGVWRGGISPAHLKYYTAEYAFKYNRRGYKYRGRVFYDLAHATMHHEHVTSEIIWSAKKRAQLALEEQQNETSP